MSEEPAAPAPDGDDVARLIRLAGKPPEVPAERAARVALAVRERWAHEVAARRRRRTLWAAAGLAAAAALAAIVLRPAPGAPLLPAAPASPPTLVEALTGPAWSRPAGGTAAAPALPLEIDDRVASGSAVETGADGRVALGLGSGHSLRLDHSTTIRLLADGSVALERGAIYVDSGGGLPSSEPGLVVQTPLGEIHEIGTQFEVRLGDASLRLRLREGAVLLRHGRQPHEVLVGTELTLAGDGSVVRRPIAAHDPGWEWAGLVTPTPALAGRTAREFLDWVARERGLRLVFADPAVARAAGTIAIGGALGRLGLDQALDAVLPTCRMTYRIAAGDLVVSAEPPGGMPPGR